MGMDVYHWGFGVVVVGHGDEFLLDLISDTVGFQSDFK